MCFTVPRFARREGGAKIAADLPCAGEAPCAPHLVHHPNDRRSRQRARRDPNHSPRSASPCGATTRPKACRSRCLQPTCSVFKRRAPVPRAAAARDPLLGTRGGPGGSRHPTHVGGLRARDRGVFFPMPDSATEPTVPRRLQAHSPHGAARQLADRARFVGPRVTGASNADEPEHLPSTSSREGIGRFDGLATVSCVTRCSSRRAVARR